MDINKIFISKIKQINSIFSNKISNSFIYVSPSHFTVFSFRRRSTGLILLLEKKILFLKQGFAALPLNLYTLVVFITHHWNGLRTCEYFKA